MGDIAEEVKREYQLLDEDASARDMQAARDKGYTVIVREPKQLLIDLDDGDMPRFRRSLRRFCEVQAVSAWRHWPSSSPGHIHIMVELDTTAVDAPTDAEAVAMQSMLGSDPKRELLALKRIALDNPYYSFLFQPPGTVETVEPPPTMD